MQNAEGTLKLEIGNSKLEIGVKEEFFFSNFKFLISVCLSLS